MFEFSKFIAFTILAMSTTIMSYNDNEIEEEPGHNYTFLIKGGYKPEKHTLHKYIVSLRFEKPKKFFGDNHFCAGTLVTSKAVLTTAHCGVAIYIKAFADIYAVAGSPYLFNITSTTQIRVVKKVVIHPDYQEHIGIADLALLLLKEEIQVDGIDVAILPLAKHTPQLKTACIICGWGEIFAGGPKTAELIYSNLTVAVCLQKNDQICLLEHAIVTRPFTGGGDSGGPLICNGELAGIASKALFEVDLVDEAENGPHYTFFTDVAEYRNWILDNNGVKIDFNANFLLVLLFGLNFI